ncbi:hypothetical protein NXV57_03790 [Bacteroides thetaiotaomicron]|nr:hypothetical protein [Bacteroides thetaiotaomicron]
MDIISARVPEVCWRGNYPYDGKGYWDGDALVWGQGGGLSAFVAMRDATKESEVENIYGAMDDMMFKGIQYFCRTGSWNPGLFLLPGCR